MSATPNYVYDRSEERIMRNRIRRQRELRQHIIICIISILLVFAIVFILGTTRSEASQKSDQILYKHYTSIQVHYGDTLYSIAEKYVEPSKNTVSSFIKEVSYMNDINNPDLLVAGQYISIPYYAPVTE